VQKYFIMAQKSSKGAGLLHVMENNIFGAFPLQKTAAARNDNKKKHETVTASQFMHAKHIRN